MRSKAQLIVGVLLGCLLSAALTSFSRHSVWADDELAKAPPADPAAVDNEELTAMYDLDQADRKPMMQGDSPTDWWSVGRLIARDLLDRRDL